MAKTGDLPTKFALEKGSQNQIVFGILNINKPIGVTSRDVVTRVVKILRQETGEKIKAGHAGTLDPMASGVLIVCLGKATRLIQFIQRNTKCYDGEFRLDVSSESVDLETEVVPLQTPAQPSRQSIEDALPDFRGQILQKPPAYSAISIGGQRAYKLARKGIEFEIKPKSVLIEKISIGGYDYPHLSLNIECGSGTYIRSLGQDLARAVDSDAVMTKLVRTSIGKFKIQNALEFDELDADLIRDRISEPSNAVSSLAQVEVTVEEHQLLSTGRLIDASRFQFSENEIPSEIAAFSTDRKLVAILEPRSGQLKPLFNLA